MPIYIFHLRRPNEAPTGLEVVTLATDADAFRKAGELLNEHASCEHVEVWEGERPVVSRHREQPVIRPVDVSDDRPRQAGRSAAG
ncbi:MAG TPA: hypothetical protein VFW13_09420 [Phenylobacterium sp.]|nr:hypothetical protein [Phenylobacterium sp.]